MKLGASRSRGNRTVYNIVKRRSLLETRHHGAFSQTRSENCARVEGHREPAEGALGDKHTNLEFGVSCPNWNLFFVGMVFLGLRGVEGASRKPLPEGDHVVTN